MDKTTLQALQITKEIVVKFVETGRISPGNFAEHFGPIYREVLRTIEAEKITATNITTTGTTRSVEIMTTSLAVTVRAPEDVISQITAENVRVVVDLTNYKATSGTVAVPAKIYVDGFSNAGAVGEYVVNVRFTGG